jgi:hypothetical protein
VDKDDDHDDVPERLWFSLLAPPMEPRTNPKATSRSNIFDQFVISQDLLDDLFICAMPLIPSLLMGQIMGLHF